MKFQRNDMININSSSVKIKIINNNDFIITIPLFYSKLFNFDTIIDIMKMNQDSNYERNYNEELLESI